MRYRDLALGFATLEEALNSYRVQELKELAGLVMHKPPTRHGELVTAIREAMAGDGLRKLWDRLSPLDRDAVSEALHSPEGCLDREQFIAKYGKAPGLLVPDSSGAGGKTRLSLLALFIHDGVWIPRDLQARLRAFVPEPRPVEIATMEDLPVAVELPRSEFVFQTRTSKKRTELVRLVRQETAGPALHDILAVLRLVEAGKVGVSGRTGRVTASGAKTILECLHSGDFYPVEKVEAASDTMRPYAWPLILQAAGLASATGDRLRLTRAGVKALASPPHEVIRSAWDRWLESTLLDEFSRIEVIKGQRGGGLRGMTAVADRRQAIADALADCPPGRWIALDEFFRYVRASGNDFGVTRNLWKLHVGDSAQYGSLGYAGFGKWEIVQGRYAMAFLWEYAGTMGLLDVAYIPPEGARQDYADLWGVDDREFFSRYDGLRFIRVNGLGAWCLGIATEYVPGSPDVRAVLKVLPNLEVVSILPGGLPPGDVLFLERVAHRVSDAVWRLDRKMALAAAEAGLQPQEMEVFLAARCDTPLPETVAALFTDLRDRTGKLADLGPARLIEAADAALARLVTSDRRLARLCRLAGERHIVVPAGSEAAFRRALRDLGYGVPPIRTAAPDAAGGPTPTGEDE